MQAPGTYNSGPRFKRLEYMSIVYSDAHFLREGLPSAEIPKQVDYQDERRDPPSLDGWKNVMDRVTAPIPSEVLCKDLEGDRVTGPPPGWNSDQKSV